MWSLVSYLQFSHLAWVQTDRKSGGLGDLQYPLVSDVTKSISKSYGVLIPDQVWEYPNILLCEASRIQNCKIIGSVFMPILISYLLVILLAWPRVYSYYKVIFPLNYKAQAAPDISLIKVH